MDFFKVNYNSGRKYIIKKSSSINKRRQLKNVKNHRWHAISLQNGSRRKCRTFSSAQKNPRFFEGLSTPTNITKCIKKQIKYLCTSFINGEQLLSFIFALHYTTTLLSTSDSVHTGGICGVLITHCLRHNSQKHNVYITTFSYL